MTHVAVLGARRRSRGWRISLPVDHHAKHGAGYPLTYAIPGARIAQWRLTESDQWQDLPALPSGARVDGVEGVRLDGDTLYVSKAFPADSPTWHLRAPGATGAPTICARYDNRAIAVVFTYDDTPSPAGWAGVTAAHQSSRLWMTPALNGNRFGTEGGMLPAADAAAAIAAGYVEPANHSWSHVSMNTPPNYSDQALANSEVYGGRDALIAVGMPPQSRGRVHSYVYPGGASPEIIHWTVAAAGHLVGRGVIVSTVVPYHLGEVTHYGYISGHPPSYNPASGELQSLRSIEAQQSAADGALAKLQQSRANGSTLLHIYTYVIQYSWGASDPWPQMLQQMGAATDIWSVGLGHCALYKVTRDHTTIAAA